MCVELNVFLFVWVFAYCTMLTDSKKGIWQRQQTHAEFLQKATGRCIKTWVPERNTYKSWYTTVDIQLKGNLILQKP